MKKTFETNKGNVYDIQTKNSILNITKINENKDTLYLNVNYLISNFDLSDVEDFLDKPGKFNSNEKCEILLDVCVAINTSSNDFNYYTDHFSILNIYSNYNEGHILKDNVIKNDILYYLSEVPNIINPFLGQIINIKKIK